MMGTVERIVYYDVKPVTTIHSVSRRKSNIDQASRDTHPEEGARSAYLLHLVRENDPEKDPE
jgi:hypothetical protein